jgi:hypothetical protein
LRSLANTIIAFTQHCCGRQSHAGVICKAKLIRPAARPHGVLDELFAGETKAIAQGWNSAPGIVGFLDAPNHVRIRAITQLTRVASGQQVDVSVDMFPGEVLRARVAVLSPASGSTFALLPPDNATGNFTKVVQRIPVRIEFQPGQPLVQRLRPGMSVVTRIRVTNDDPPVATAAAAPNQGTMRGP